MILEYLQTNDQITKNIFERLFKRKSIYELFLVDNADAVIDAGTDKVIFLQHAAGKNMGFDVFAFSIDDSKAYGWVFVLIAHDLQADNMQNFYVRILTNVH